MLKNIKACLFDLDGVVVFTDKYHYLAWKRLADTRGWKFDETVNHRLRGVPRLDSLQIILDHNGVVLPEAEKTGLADLKNSYYKKLLAGIGPDDLYPGAVKFIQKLRSSGQRIALCSSSRNAGFVLKKLGLTDLFDVVVTGADVVRSKPDPEIFLLASRKLGIHPFNCVVFEDAASGVEAALAAKMKCVGIGDRSLLPSAPQTVTSYAKIDITALIEMGRISRPEALPWSVREETVNPPDAAWLESVFSLCNGFMGLRGAHEESSPALADFSHPGFYVNGFHENVPLHLVMPEKDSPKYTQFMVNLCDWRRIGLWVEGENFDLLTGSVSDYLRELDMQRGVLVRSLVWTSPSGRRIRLVSERLVSMARLHNAAIRYSATPLNFSGSFKFVSRLDCRQKTIGAGEKAVEKIRLENREDGSVVFRYRTPVSGLEAAGVCGHRVIGARPAVAVRFEADSAEWSAVLPARKGITVTIEKHIAVHTTIESPAEALEALSMRDADRAMEEGFGILLREQEKFWQDWWESADVVIDGPVADQQAVRFNIFHLRQNCPSDGLRSISATGLSGDNYMGWVFWDTETFMNPLFAYTKPELARALLSYRSGKLPQARLRAAEMRGPGASFPWSTIDGFETNAGVLVSYAQVHINPDIVFALRQYWRNTGDDAFLFGSGAEMLFETARFMFGLGAFVPEKGGRFCINYVCGPDEYNYAVNNNCYTNIMTREHFLFAFEVWNLIKSKAPKKWKALAGKTGVTEKEVEEWKRAANQMNIPFNRELGIHEQDDGYLGRNPVDMSVWPKNYEIKKDLTGLQLGRMRVTKQADTVLLMVLLRDRFEKTVRKANYEFYEPLTLHASSLSPAVYAVAAADLGKITEAYDFFRQSAFLDLYNFKNNTQSGIHLACSGGVWSAVVAGFAGMTDSDEGLSFSPCLPEDWKGLSFKLRWRGRVISCRINRTGSVFRLIDGPACEISYEGKRLMLRSAHRKRTRG